jgi:thioesterase domain-containing protein
VLDLPATHLGVMGPPRVAQVAARIEALLDSVA